MRTQEENARLGWKRLERAVAAGKLLPKVWGILSDLSLDEKARVVRARECLARSAGKFVGVTVGEERQLEG